MRTELRREEQDWADKPNPVTSAEARDVWSIDLLSTFARARARARANVVPLAGVEGPALAGPEKSELQICW